MSDYSWSEAPIYPPLPLYQSGIHAAILPSGVVELRSRWTGPEQYPWYADNGTPFFPRQRNANSLLKQMYRDGDFDDYKRSVETARKAHKKWRVDALRACEGVADPQPGELALLRAANERLLSEARPDNGPDSPGVA